MKNLLANLDVRTQGARDVAMHLLTEIASGRLRAGVKLPSERSLSNDFGVSRGAVRRVLAEFGKQGLVEPARGSGTFVSAHAEAMLHKPHMVPDAHVSPAELMEARLRIEPLMPALVVRHATPADFARMQECLERSEQSDDIDEFEYWDGELHKAFAQATHNAFFVLILELGNKVREQGDWGWLKRKSLTPQRRLHIEDEHRQIVAALIDRDAERAQRLLREHLEQVQLNLFGA